MNAAIDGFFFCLAFLRTASEVIVRRHLEWIWPSKLWAWPCWLLCGYRKSFDWGNSKIQLSWKASFFPFFHWAENLSINHRWHQYMAKNGGSAAQCPLFAGKHEQMGIGFVGWKPYFLMPRFVCVPLAFPHSGGCPPLVPGRVHGRDNHFLSLLALWGDCRVPHFMAVMIGLVGKHFGNQN